MTAPELSTAMRHTAVFEQGALVGYFMEVPKARFVVFGIEKYFFVLVLGVHEMLTNGNSREAIAVRDR